MHLAAKNPRGIDKSIIDLLIEKGCDVMCQDEVTGFFYCEVINVNFRTERRLTRSPKMVKQELSSGNITYVIILIQFRM